MMHIRVRAISAVSIVLVVVILVLAPYFFDVALLVAKPLRRHDTAGPCDSLVVLGNRLNHGRLSSQGIARLDHAIRLFRRGVAQHIIVTGGNSSGTGVESEAMATYLASRGVPLATITQEDASLTTFENIRNVTSILHRRAYRSVHIVTSSYHTRRSAHLASDFGWAYTIDGPVQTAHTLRSATEQWDELKWVLREYGATVWFDLRYYRRSCLLALVSFGLVMLSLVKYYDWLARNAVWCFRRGENYRAFLARQRLVTVEKVLEANNLFQRGHMAWTDWIATAPLGPILHQLYRYPSVLLMLDTALIVNLVRGQRGPGVYGLFFAVIAGVLVGTVVRLANRVYLGEYADLDDSITLTRARPSITPAWLMTPPVHWIGWLMLVDLIAFIASLCLAWRASMVLGSDLGVAAIIDANPLAAVVVVASLITFAGAMVGSLLYSRTLRTKPFLNAEDFMKKGLVLVSTPTEREAVNAWFATNGIVVESRELNRRYVEVVTIPAKQGTWVVTVGQGTTEGPHAAQAAVSSLCRAISPDLAMLVGMCGGFKENGARENSVVIPRAVFNYEPRKVQDGQEYLAPTPYRTDGQFTDLINALRGRGIFGGLDVVQDKDYVSGETVFDDKDDPLRRKLVALSRDIVACETEGHGFLHAIWELQREQPTLRAAIIKGISDGSDGTMGEDKKTRQMRATSNALSVAVMALKEF